MSNEIYVGNKPVMNYCQAIIQALYNNDAAKVLARGYAISRAVDAVEVTKNRFFTDLEVKSIDIGTEELTNDEGRSRNVSTITIVMKNGK
jgi:DNA-binding protein